MKFNLFFAIISSLLSCCYSSASSKPVDIKKAYFKQIAQQPYVARAYFCEVNKINGKYAGYVDGVGLFCSTGYKKPIIPLDIYSFLSSYIRKSEISAEWKKQVDKSLTPDDIPIKEISDFQPNYTSLLNSLNRFENFCLAAFNDEYLITEHSEGKTLVVEFKPKKGIDSYYSGKILIKNGMVCSVMLDEAEYYYEPVRSVIKASLSITFTTIDCNIYPNQLKASIKHQNMETMVFIQVESNPASVDKLDYQEYSITNNNEINPYISYSKNCWPGSHAKIENSDQIENDLKAGPLEQQFVKNSGRYYYNHTEYDGSVVVPSPEVWIYIQSKINEYNQIITHNEIK